MSGPLAGVKVIDMTTVAMGPYATMILGDMGADVIKVEPPEGDVFRHAAPMRNPGMGAAFLNLNRNKRSIVLDLKQDDDKALMLELLADSDVFVSNTRPAGLRRLGLDYESLKGRNPRLIFCGTYGFGERGPYAGRPAFDDVIQAMSGLAALQGHNSKDGPEYVNTIMADKVAGLTATYAISMALYEREKSGLGQSIEVPMFETMVSFNLIEHLAGQTFVPPLGDMGYERVLSPHRRPYRTKDGFLGLLPYTSAHWKKFFELCGRPELVADQRFMDPQKRSENINTLYGIVAEVMKMQTTAQWQDVLGKADIPMAPIIEPDRLLEDRHLQATGFFTKVQHSSEGELRAAGIPVTFSRTPGATTRQAPKLGEQTRDVRAAPRA